MLKKIIFAIFIFFALSATALADGVAKENWKAMSPTVKVESYKWQWNGSVAGISRGSGTIISADGLVLTNNHVIFDETEQRPLDAFGICITFEAAKEPLCDYTANLLAYDKDLDLAILKINQSDVFDKKLHELKFLEAKAGSAPKENQEAQVIGYPASGGDTITVTKGHISGFDEFNGYKYFKTDTDFDHGSSGGTVLNASGQFIGVPTYIRTYAENIGYFLDLNEGIAWIKEHQNDFIQPNAKAKNELSREMARLSDSNRTLEYVSGSYPRFKIKLKEGWKFFDISDTSLAAAQKNVENGAGINLQIEYYPFAIDNGYMKRLDQEYINTRKTFQDFRREVVRFAGYESIKITYTAYDQRNTIIYIPYGYTLIGLSYSIDLEKEKMQIAELNPVLSSFEFTGKPEMQPNLEKTMRFDEPPFQIGAAGNFQIQKAVGPDNGDLLVKGVQKGNYEGEFQVQYSFVPWDSQQLTIKERLDEDIKNLSDRGLKLLSKKEDVLLDGLKGYIYTIEYEGQLYQQIRRQLVLKLPQGQYEWLILYDDLGKNFDKNLPLISQMLKSFVYEGVPAPEKGKYDFGVLGNRFKDIQYHPFATAISDLADKNLVKGDKDNRFHPEFYARKADALKLILESKNHLERERGIGREVNFADYSTHTKNQRWFDSYLAYAQTKGIPGQFQFQPYHAITLAEAIEWLTVIYEIPVWQGKTREWYKRYMDKAFELGWIPSGLSDPEEFLTRAGLAELVSNVYNQAK